MQTKEQIQEKITALQKALLDDTPQMPLLLRDIHSQLKQNPEVVTLLSEDEIAAIVSGLSKQTQSHLAGSMMKATKSASATKALKRVTNDELGF